MTRRGSHAEPEEKSKTVKVPSLDEIIHYLDSQSKTKDDEYGQNARNERVHLIAQKLMRLDPKAFEICTKSIEGILAQEQAKSQDSFKSGEVPPRRSVSRK